ncbi:MAG: hypothetical protein HYS26_01105 [Candidatus Kaiserbacteria bacterium]|nr:MAG: hypothetical protein HYS26_01105 [Candidatus Kaiserbacteria bacterium]
MQPPFLPSILVEYGTHIVLAFDTTAPGIVFLNECTGDTIGAYGIQYPHYRDSLFLTTTGPAEYPTWTWNFEQRLFEQTPPKLLTKEIREKSALAVGKLKVVQTIMRNISRLRLRFETGISLQDSVYLEKRIEALSFKNAGYDEVVLPEYPHVLLYADYAGLSPRQAADDIIFKSKIATEQLAKTELLRIIYFNKIKKAKAVAELDAITETFFRDPYVGTLS